MFEKSADLVGKSRKVKTGPRDKLREATAESGGDGLGQQAQFVPVTIPVHSGEKQHYGCEFLPITVWKFQPVFRNKTPMLLNHELKEQGFGFSIHFGVGLSLHLPWHY